MYCRVVFRNDNNRNTIIIIILWCRIFLEKLIVILLVKTPHPLMEAEGSLPYSQKAASGPYTELFKFSPHVITLFL